MDSVLRIRTRLEKAGWDNGPRSIWFTGVDTGELSAPVPSAATIARILAESGVVKANPRKRPRSSWIRFVRSAAMELWQLDAFEFKLYDIAASKVTVYQLVDDATRFDVGTQSFCDPENSTDTITTLTAAISAYGAPQEVLSDNSSAFNLSRLGMISPTERFLGKHGTLGISGRFRHPQTQGKNERSHQTLLRFLKANKPETIEALQRMITAYRSYYNDRRPHQGLPGSMRPAQAWEAAEHHPSDGTPITVAELEARAAGYRDRTLAKDAIEAPQGQAGDLTRQARQEKPTLSGGRLRDAPEQIEIRRENPQIYYHGRIFKVPTHLVGTYHRVSTGEDFTLFDVEDGAEAIYFPLPPHTAENQRLIPLWKVRGARIRDPKPSWVTKQIEYSAEHYARDR